MCVCASVCNQFLELRNYQFSGEGESWGSSWYLLTYLRCHPPPPFQCNPSPFSVSEPPIGILKRFQDRFLFRKKHSCSTSWQDTLPPPSGYSQILMVKKVYLAHFMKRLSINSSQFNEKTKHVFASLLPRLKQSTFLNMGVFVSVTDLYPLWKFFISYFHKVAFCVSVCVCVTFFVRHTIIFWEKNGVKWSLMATMTQQCCQILPLDCYVKF